MSDQIGPTTSELTAAEQVSPPSLAAFEDLEILLLDRAHDDRESLEHWLRAKGLAVTAVACFDHARSALRAERFPLVLLALEPTAQEAVKFAREISDDQPARAIVVISSKFDDADTLVELQHLGVGLLPKPWTSNAFQNVVRLTFDHARRTDGAETKRGDGGDLRVEVTSARGTISIDGREIRLTPRVFRLASYLLSAAGRTVPTTEIAQRVLERCDQSSGEAVRGAIRELRLAVRGTRLRIETYRGHGYFIHKSFARKTHGTPT